MNNYYRSVLIYLFETIKAVLTSCDQIINQRFTNKQAKMLAELSLAYVSNYLSISF